MIDFLTIYTLALTFAAAYFISAFVHLRRENSKLSDEARIQQKDAIWYMLRYNKQVEKTNALKKELNQLKDSASLGYKVTNTDTYRED